MPPREVIKVKDIEISFQTINESDYISLTDIAKYKDKERTNYIVQNWMRTRSTIEFIGLWELLNNPCFKRIDFDAFKNQASLNNYKISAKEWVQKTKLLIRDGLSQQTRLKRLNSAAIAQLQSLINNSNTKYLN